VVDVPLPSDGDDDDEEVELVSLEQGEPEE
jgi:hypothetical protein